MKEKYEKIETKKNIKNKIKEIIYNMNYKIFMQNTILMESNPDLQDNTGALYREMLKRNINYKIKIVWFVRSDEFRNCKIKNVKFININKTKKIILRFYQYFTKYIIDCNNALPKVNKNQFRFFLTHGEPIKFVPEYSLSIGKCDYVLETSPAFNDFSIQYYPIEKENIVNLGYPRNDDLFNRNEKAEKFAKKFNSKKIIIWMPTYRNNQNISDKAGKANVFHMPLKYKYVVPCIETKSEIIDLNNLLKDKNITLIIKPHPVEDLSNINKLNLSNIKILLEEDLKKENLNIYQFLSVTDAMITDYSSIYYDYLLTKKPIGLAIPDLEEFSKHMQIYWSNYKEAIVGEYIYTFENLLDFIKNVSNEEDITFDKRMEKLKIYHKYQDNKSSERVLNFFLEKIGYKENEK